jgi:mRNA-degrading endonuclease RelE of RelBE toxin-antitoxin system
MKFRRTNRFLRAYRKLDERYRTPVKKALTQFAADRTYPGLRVKRLQGTDRIWEMRAGRDIRITFEFDTDDEGTTIVVLRNVGHHDPTLRNP